MCSRSRGAMRPSFAGPLSLLEREGAGKTGCTLHPRSHVQDAQSKRTRAYRFSGNTPAFPAQWFYGLLRALLGDRAFLPPSLLKRWLPGSLTPASGCRDHTTSPYALARSSYAPSRPPHPAPNVRDDREAPLLEGRGMGRAGSADLPDGESEIFFGRRLDSFLVICPSGN